MKKDFNVGDRVEILSCDNRTGTIKGIAYPFVYVLIDNGFELSLAYRKKELRLLK